MSEVPGPSPTTSTSPGELYLEFFEQHFPGVVQDGILDAAMLGEFLSVQVSGLKDGKERFGIMWAGKKNAVLALQTPSFAALAPDFEKSKHFENADNVFIEGDNLEVLKLLQSAYNDKVKLIYLDPPYNKGKEFIYHDDFSDPVQHYLEVTGQVDADGNKLVANLETAGRKHSNWLSMMYPRLVLARNLLSTDGAIAISIDDVELSNLVALLDLIFGSENRQAVMPRRTKSSGKSGEGIAKNHDYLVIYSRNSSEFKVFQEDHTDPGFKHEDEHLATRGKFKLNQTLDYSSLGYQASLDFPIEIEGKTIVPGGLRSAEKIFRWRWSKAKVAFGKEHGFLVVKTGTDGEPRIYSKTYQNATIAKSRNGEYSVVITPRTKAGTTLEFMDSKYSNDVGTKDLKDILPNVDFDYPKPVALIKKLCVWLTEPDDIVMDLFAGSGTTAQAVMELNMELEHSRKFVLVNLPEELDEGKTAFQAGYKTVSDVSLARINASMEATLGANGSSLRVFKLAPSAFELRAGEQKEGLFELFPNTLTANASLDVAASSILLKSGHLLSEKIITKSVSGGSIYVSGTSLVCCSLEVTEEIIDECLAGPYTFLAFLEDSFAGKDDLKAKAFFGARNRNQIVKFY